MAQLFSLGRLAHQMKTKYFSSLLALVFLVGCAATSRQGFTHAPLTATKHDYYLFRTQMIDGDYPKNGGPAPTVYVLIEPSGKAPCVFQQFASWQMEAWLTHEARGSAVHYRQNALIFPSPTAAQWEGFKAFCKTNDITLINESDMD